jgi:N-methylhydantoinase B
MMATVVEDPIEFELFKNAIHSIADEMALTIHRTTYSGVLKDNMDYSTAFCDGAGILVAQGLTLPGHLGSMPTAMAAVMRRYGNDIRPGDVFAMNDPFEGGMHLPDIFVFKPIFVDGERLAFAATICHHTDVGGRVAGSNASDSTEIYQEGVRIPPLKIFEEGRRNETFFMLMEANVRVPVKVFGDLRAQLAACHIAENAFTELVRSYGAAKVQSYMRELIAYTERLTRAAIAELPDGVFSFEDFIDDDGIDIGRKIPLRVTIKKQGDGMVVDWTGSSPQVKGAINNTLSYTKSASYCGIKCVLSSAIPNNEGVFRAIDVIAPPGTIANAVLPASCAARGLTGFRMVDTMLGALAMMLPDRVMAASDGGNVGVSIGGWTKERKPFIWVDFSCAAWGGRPWADGIDGNSNIFANQSSQSVEITEAEQPFEILRYELIDDAGGPGKFRGGCSYRRDFRLLEEEATLQIRSDRRDVPPYGLYGGQPGRPSMLWLNGKELPSKPTLAFKRGDVFREEVAGAGGWGDPLERDPARVLHDVRNEFVTLRSAQDDYGVVIDPASWTVDAAGTDALRRKLRAARGWKEVPKVVRESSPLPLREREGPARSAGG